MRHYIVHDSKGKILRTGYCQDECFDLLAEEGEFVIEGQANDAVDKIEIEEFDDQGKPKKVKIKKKTQAEIDAGKPPEIPESEKPAYITKGQYDDLLKRIAELEKK